MRGLPLQHDCTQATTPPPQHAGCLPAALLTCPLPPLLQGRGLSTHAYTHSLETDHHMFMKLENGKVR